MVNPLSRTNVLGVGISAVDMPLALAEIAGWIERREAHYVCLRDVHGVVLCQDDEELRRIHGEAGLVTPDGMPLVWLSRLAGHRNVRRVYGPDLMLALCAAGIDKGYRHFLYGSTPGTLDRLESRLVERLTGLEIAGKISPPFREPTAEEEAAFVEKMSAARADVVWVGLSTPKQERWMHAHVGKVGAPVLIGVGAAFDFHAAVKLQAHRWIQHSGFEWLFRLITEPRRLGRRYLVTVPRFMLLVVAQKIGLRRWELS